MSKIYNSEVYKLAKSYCRDAPKAIETITKFQKDMTKFSMYKPVRELLHQLTFTKDKIQILLHNAEKIKNKKGRVE